jgi:hypothetical protein
MRLRARHLATPVLWYRHAETRRTLVLVLNSHIGAAGYFAAMCARISELEARGYAVQWEGITKAGEQAWAEATAGEKAAHEVMTALYRDRPRALAHSLGWAYQGDIELPDGWANGDLTDLELVRAIGPAAVCAMGADIDARSAKLGARRDAFALAMGPLILRALARPHDRLSQAIANQAPDVHAVLLGQRSKRAAAADPGRDTVMVWGAEHADSIEAALAAAGWVRMSRRRWLTVGRLPAFARSAAGVFSVAYQVGIDTFRAEQAKARRGASA